MKKKAQKIRSARDAMQERDPSQENSNKKNGSPGTRVLTALICLAVCIYFGVQVYDSSADPLICAVAYTYQVEDTISVTGFVVRDELVLDDSGGGLLRLTRSEGERVSKGGKVAQIYSDQASLDRQTEIDKLQTQLDQLNYASEAASASEAALQLDSQIAEKLVTMRRAVVSDRLDTALDSVANLEALVLRRDYTYTDAEELKTQTAEIQSQLNTLKAQAAGSSRIVTAPRAGLYSAVVDGYETVLTPDMVDTLTPSDLSSLQPSGASSDLGKLVLGDTWYYVASLSVDDARQLTEGTSEILRFAKGVDRDLRVTVQSVSAEENGRVAVVFCGHTYLTLLTLLRQQSADIVRSSTSGIRVPQQAIRVDDNGTAGVYCIVGMKARFKPVTVLWSADDEYALVRARGTGETTLRPGDEVILSAGGLTDGAVISYAG
jgi:hypothetical protein